MWLRALGKTSEQGASDAVSIIAGLGNPGRKYERTRHNVGFDALDELAARFGGVASHEKFEAKYARVRHGDRQAVLLWPQTYMNVSGRSIAAAMRFYKTDPASLLVICDDLALPPGKLRLRRSGSSGGQKGLKNTIEQIGSDQFARLRIGIGETPPGWDTADYVLGRVGGEEADVIRAACVRAADAALCWLVDGVDTAMNKYNRESTQT